MIGGIKVYLAGPITNVESPNKWRKEAVENNTEEDMVTFLIPMDQYDNPDEVQDVSDTSYTNEEVWESDLEMVEEADVIVARWMVGVDSLGTMSEMVEADKMGKTVIVMSNGDPSDFSPPVEYYSDVWARSPEELDVSTVVLNCMLSDLLKEADDDGQR